MSGRNFLLIAAVTLGASLRAGASQPFITEFMARNQGTLLDEDAQSSDWLELYNPGDTAVDLEGWSLTDDVKKLDKWRFPKVSLGAAADPTPVSGSLNAPPPTFSRPGATPLESLTKSTKLRPMIGCSPSVGNRVAEACRPITCSGTPRPISVNAWRADNARSLNTCCRCCTSRNREYEKPMRVRLLAWSVDASLTNRSGS